MKASAEAPPHPAASSTAAAQTTVVALLVSALRSRLEIIADRAWYARDPEGHLNALMAVSAKIESHSAELPAPVHPQLQHYLERRSYDKALAFLEGQPPEDIGHAH